MTQAYRELSAEGRENEYEENKKVRESFVYPNDLRQHASARQLIFARLASGSFLSGLGLFSSLLARIIHRRGAEDAEGVLILTLRTLCLCGEYASDSLW